MFFWGGRGAIAWIISLNSHNILPAHAITLKYGMENNTSVYSELWNFQYVLYLQPLGIYSDSTLSLATFCTPGSIVESLFRASEVISVLGLLDL